MNDEPGRLDAYVEGVLADRRARPRPLVAAEDLDPATRRAADLLARTLVRFHPSFRFEEALAARLREAGSAMAWPAVPGEPSSLGARLIAFPASPSSGLPRGHGLLVSGAIASGLSLAGAAYLAWRRGHRVAL